MAIATPEEVKKNEEVTLRLHGTTDATVWTDAFMELHGDRLDQIDWGLMVGWFANALEVGRREGRETA